jgi:hypothetical protein
MKRITAHDALFTLARLLAAAMLFYALGRHPMNYYHALRWVVFLVSVWSAYTAVAGAAYAWGAAFVACLIVFSPLAPFHFTRSTWGNIDVAAGVLMVLSVIGMRVQVEEGVESEPKAL